MSYLQKEMGSDFRRCAQPGLWLEDYEWRGKNGLVHLEKDKAEDLKYFSVILFSVLVVHWYLYCWCGYAEDEVHGFLIIYVYRKINDNPVFSK